MAKDKSTKPIPISNLKYLLDKGKLDTKPRYQRGPVWTLSQKQLLIDSLLRQIDIPKLYFRQVSKPPVEYEVVDGQQRLLAIHSFLEPTSYKLADDADDVNGFPIAGKTFHELQTDIQMQFQATALDVVTLNSDYSDDDIQDMFLRLQNGTPLNAAEKRQALPGNMREVVKELAGHPIFKLCSFKDHRFAYGDAAAKVPAHYHRR